MVKTATLADVLFAAPDSESSAHLLAVARKIFSDTFAQRFDPKAFEDFCDYTYGPTGPMAKDLCDPTVQWLVATHRNQPIGYAKLTPLRAPVSNALRGAMELQQIYVLSSWQGRGMAEELMTWAIKSAHQTGAPELYLAVFDHNERAKRFYVRHGFEEVGCCTFLLGGRPYDDRIWRKILRK